ncbi:hypothetical protein BS17DRAFT_765008 [Gyrodon lividus]|nr:hypothetical protein BS17DRAFT_765008 [Gyrodon lividus]
MSSIQSHYFPTQQRTYKSPEFMPSSANEEFGPPNDSPKPKPKAATAATREAVESKITAENIGKRYSVYDPRQLRKRIGAVVEVKARQHEEVDGTSLNSQLINFVFLPVKSHRCRLCSRPLRVELQQIATKTTELEVKYMMMVDKMQDHQCELHTALIQTHQEGFPLGTYEAIKTHVAQLTFKQEKLKAKLGDKV